MPRTKTPATSIRTCSNCLNAYNSPHYSQPRCWNKEWLYEGNEKADCSVRPDETCGTWQRRADNQKPLVFAKAVQLSLFDLNNF